jgi:hypothetical protein
MTRTKSEAKPFTLEIRKPFSTFTEGKPTPIPYIIDGLLPEAAFSVLGGKAKHGKSSMSRIEAVAVAKGIPFLDRATRQSEVLLCSLEDPQQHVDNCLKVLDYNPDHDAEIHIVSRLSPQIEETVNALADNLAKMPHIKFVVLDTLAKVLRAKDSGNYDEMLTLCEMLHTLARETGTHIQALTHCKKVQPEDPFDGFLGSVEVRAETDTNIVLYDSRGKRLLQSETRMGTPWEPTEICAEMATVGKSSMVKRFYFGDTLAKTTEEQTAANELNTQTVVKSRIVESLKRNGGEMKMEECFKGIVGGRQRKYDARDELVKEKVIKISGVSKSSANPQRLVLLKPDWTPSRVTVTTAAIPVTLDPVPVKSRDEGQLQESRQRLAKLQKYAVDYPDVSYGTEISRLEQAIAELEGTSCTN